MYFILCKARIKYLLRNRALCFWSLIFPIILSVFFFFAFSSLGDDIEIPTVKVAIFQDEEKLLTKTIESAKYDSGQPMFKIKSVQQKDANQQMLDGKLDAYFDVSSNKLHVSEKGMSQGIFSQFLNTFSHKENLVQQISTSKSFDLDKIDFSKLSESHIKDVSISDKNLDISFTYFYSLIAMACMYGAFWGCRCISEIQADQSPLGARVCVSPTPKAKMLLADISVSLGFLFVEMMVFLGFLHFTYGIEFGTNLPLLTLAIFTSCMVSTSLGYLLGAYVKKEYDSKINYIISISMVCSALSGMFGTPSLRFTIQQDFPILHYINPTSLLNDCFYQLQFFDSNKQFFTNILAMVLLTIIFGILAFIKIRRERYDSI